MAKKFLTPIDLNQLELQNATFQILGSDPGSPVQGQFFYHSGTQKFKFRNATTWSIPVLSGEIVNADINASAAIALSKLATDPLARANHTGTQTASTISDFDTQVRTSRLDQMASPTASVSLNNQKITNLALPAAGSDAATKAYVDDIASGLDVKKSVRAATTADITLSGTQTIDGVSVIANDRVLVKDQATAANNGLYTCQAGAWQRTTDADSDAEVTTGLFVFVEEGTTNGDTGWVLTTNNPITVGSTGLAFSQFSSSAAVTAGDALQKTGSELDVLFNNTSIGINGSNQLEIKTTWTGQTAITTLGTITTGTWNATTLGVLYGGSGQTTSKAARETGFGAAGYYSSATHGAGTTISITQATHGLRSTRGLLVQVQEESTGDVVVADVTVTSGGDITVTFGASQGANSKRVTVIG